MIADALASLTAVLGPGVPAVAVVMLLAEAGLLIGVVLPGVSVTVGLGVLAGTGAVPAVAAGLAAVCGAVAGPSLGYWRARRTGTGPLLPDARIPSPARRVLRLAGSRPLVAVAVGQWFAVARTLVPRLAGHQLGYPRFLLLNGPMATGWALATFGLGGLLAAGSTAAARLVTVQEVLTWVLLGVFGAAPAWTAVRMLRRRSARRAPDDRAGR